MKEQYAAYQAKIEAALREILDACGAPEPLLGAMRYSLLSGGKRLRPVLLLAACAMAGGAQREGGWHTVPPQEKADVDFALPFACGIEMIHTYSLIHDDLPAMDDDAMRRGRPTNHVVYGEGMALLAGDGLLTLAFETMIAATKRPRHIFAMQTLAKAAGVTGMVAGQCVDLDCERRGDGDAHALAYIHLHKTADLIAGAVEAGLKLAGAGERERVAGAAFGRALGLAFQVRDDLLDFEGDAAALGKATGMDAARGKLTWVALHGAEAAREAVRNETQKALSALEIFGERATFLRETASALVERDT